MSRAARSTKPPSALKVEIRNVQVVSPSMCSDLYVDGERVGHVNRVAGNCVTWALANEKVIAKLTDLARLKGMSIDEFFSEMIRPWSAGVMEIQPDAAITGLARQLGDHLARFPTHVEGQHTPGKIAKANAEYQRLLTAWTHERERMIREIERLSRDLAAKAPPPEAKRFLFEVTKDDAGEDEISIVCPYCQAHDEIGRTYTVDWCEDAKVKIFEDKPYIRVNLDSGATQIEGNSDDSLYCRSCGEKGKPPLWEGAEVEVTDE